VPAIKGDMYITHCNYSQPASIKLDNENIGGHLTPLQTDFKLDERHVIKNENAALARLPSSTERISCSQVFYIYVEGI